MINRIFNSEQKSISAASLILAVSYITSAILGLFRDRLLAGIFGAGNELDIYYTAFTVPDFIALILVFGAIAAAVIPIFSSHLMKSREEAFEYLSRLLNVFLAFLIVVCGLLMWFAPEVIRIVAPGFTPEKQTMAVMLMRIMFLSPIILGMSNIISGVLQVFHRFLITALAPLLYNIGIICGILFFVPRLGLVGLAWGVVLGGALHLSVQIPALWMSGFKYKISFKINDPSIIKTIKLMVPRSLGLGAGQLNTIAITAIASTLASGSIAVFNLANNLSSIFVSAVAVSVSTAAFPSMSMAFLKDDGELFLRKFLGILRQIFFLTIPISFLLFLLRVQIVRIILGVGKFSWADTKITTACLGILAFSLTSQALVLFLSKSFYASHNTKIPALISGATVIFNIFLSLVLVFGLNNIGPLSFVAQDFLRVSGVQDIGVVGLAVAFTVTAIIESLLLLYYFYKHFPKLNVDELLDCLYRVVFATFVMIIATFLTRQLLGYFLNLQIFWGIFVQLAVSGTVGLATYVVTSYWMDMPELETISRAFLKKFTAK